MRTPLRHILRTRTLAAALAGAGFLVGCGGVSGHTYQIEGGGYSIDFQSGGKAVERLGGQQQDTCTYVEDSKSVTLTCPGARPVVFTINDKQQLLAPPDSMLRAMGPLSRK
jgi:hypothetical protein